MRLALATCVALFATPAFACNVTVDTIALKKGDVTSTSVVNTTDGEAVLSSDAGDAIRALAKKAKDPVPVRLGSQHTSLLLKDAVSERGATFFKETILTIPGKTNADGLVLQQELKRCL